MDRIALTEFGWFLLQVVYNAEQEGADLSEAGNDARLKAGLTVEQYGRALRRLEDEGMLEADILPDGSGHVVDAAILRITGPGTMYVEHRLKGETQ